MIAKKRTKSKAVAPRLVRRQRRLVEFVSVGKLRIFFRGSLGHPVMSEQQSQRALPDNGKTDGRRRIEGHLGTFEADFNLMGVSIRPAHDDSMMWVVAHGLNIN
jgi:hypothetical protein